MNELNNKLNYDTGEIKILKKSNLAPELQESEQIVYCDNELSAHIEPFYIELSNLADNVSLMSRKAYEQTSKILVKGLQRQYKYNYFQYKKYSDLHTGEKFLRFLWLCLKLSIFLPITAIVTLIKVLFRAGVKKRNKKVKESAESEPKAHG